MLRRCRPLARGPHRLRAARRPDGRDLSTSSFRPRVRFADLDDAPIDAYAASGDGLDKAGAYGIQGFAATLVERIDGDYFTVVGFPLARVRARTAALGYRLRPPRTPAQRHPAGPRRMSFAATLRATFSPDIGIDLGTANTVVYSHDAGILVSEPSVVAYRTSDDAIVAVGTGRQRARRPRARPDRGRAPAARRHDLRLPRRARAGQDGGRSRARVAAARIAPRVIACVPGCATDIECKAVEEAIRAAGPRSTTFVPQAVAAAIGAGLDITSTRPRMVIDIGGGTTEIAVLISCGVVAMHSIKVGGDTFDAAIAARLRHEYFAIGPLTAERLKIERGYAGRPPRPRAVRRRRNRHAQPASGGKRQVDETLVGEAMRDGIDRIARAAWSILEATAARSRRRLLEAGIVLTGGGALIPGLAGEIGIRTNVPTTVADDPLGCVARGAGEILASPGLLERLRPHADRLTRWYQSLRIGMRESYSR